MDPSKALPGLLPELLSRYNTARKRRLSLDGQITWLYWAHGAYLNNQSSTAVPKIHRHLSCPKPPSFYPVCPSRGLFCRSRPKPHGYSQDSITPSFFGNVEDAITHTPSHSQSKRRIVSRRIELVTQTVSLEALILGPLCRLRIPYLGVVINPHIVRISSESTSLDQLQVSITQCSATAKAYWTASTAPGISASVRSDTRTVIMVDYGNRDISVQSKTPALRQVS